MLEPLTAKQREILNFIEKRLLEKGFPPSIREICTAVNLSSTSSVQSQMNTLEKLGYIKRDRQNSRSIEILEESFQVTRTETVSLPIVGRVACGEPVLAQQNISSYFPIPSEYLPRTTNPLFMLTVHGDSMINVGIYDGDLLIVESASTAKNGQIAVCLIEDSATVKTFFKENGHYRLQPENDYMEPIIVDSVEVLGIVRSLFRPNLF